LIEKVSGKVTLAINQNITIKWQRIEFYPGVRRPGTGREYCPSPPQVGGTIGSRILPWAKNLPNLAMGKKPPDIAIERLEKSCHR